MALKTYFPISPSFAISHEWLSENIEEKSIKDVVIASIINFVTKQIEKLCVLHVRIW